MANEKENVIPIGESGEVGRCLLAARVEMSIPGSCICKSGAREKRS